MGKLGISRRTSGIYIILCEPAGSVFIGVSQNCEVRLRNHRMYLHGDDHRSEAYLLMRHHLSVHGKNSMKYRIYREVPAGADIQAEEEKVINDFISRGYKLYNTSFDTNLYCPAEYRKSMEMFIRYVAGKKLPAQDLHKWVLGFTKG